MWLDIFPMSRPPSSAPIEIKAPVPVAYQLRLIVRNTSDVTLDDENFITGERSSDIYVKAWVLGEKEDSQQTDVHYRFVKKNIFFFFSIKIFIYLFIFLDLYLAKEILIGDLFMILVMLKLNKELFMKKKIQFFK